MFFWLLVSNQICYVCNIRLTPINPSKHSHIVIMDVFSMLSELVFCKHFLLIFSFLQSVGVEIYLAAVGQGKL